MHRLGRRLAFAALGGTDVACLVRLRPHARLLADLAAPHRWLARAGADQAAAQLAATVLWLVALWLALGLVAWSARWLPGSPGRAADRVARLVLPRAVYRLAAGAAGLGVLLSPAAADAASGHVAHSPAPTRATHQAAAANAVPARTDVPTPTWPGDQPTATPRWPISNRSQPDRGATSRTDRRPAEVIVRPGDSLWRIAAARLGGRAGDTRIAAAWPRWYAANRAEIGTDPALIHPGQTLHPPASSQEDPS